MIKCWKNGPRPKLTIYKNVSSLRNVCLSVILEFCLSSSSVLCITFTAYTSLCRSLEYWLKIVYFTVVYPNVVGFLISYTVFCCRMDTLPYVWKYYHKNERRLCVVAHSFTKLSQYVCLINTQILVYQYARCDFKLWKAPWLYCVFEYFHT